MVKYPHLREELIELLETLTNLETQEKLWGQNAQYGHGHFVDDMHFLLDDGALADEPEKEIGIVLEYKIEAEAVGTVTQVILEIFKKIGNNEDATIYLQHPDWIKVIQAAKEALKALKRNRT